MNNRLGGPVVLRRVAWLAGGLAAAWALPALTHLLGVDVLLIPVIFVGTMSLVHGVRTLFDQVMIAAAILFGATSLFGLVITFWPWGFHPVPMAGVMLSAIVLTAAAAGRRPVLRGFGRIPDLLALACAGCVSLLAAYPFLRTDAAGRLKVMLSSEDFARHFIMFDTIGLLRGYLFAHKDLAAPYVPTGFGLESYPQGAHLTFLVLDRFIRSATSQADGVTEMNWLVWCNLLSFMFFATATIWAVRRMAGPELDTARALAVFGITGAYIFFFDPVTILLGGFPNELLGLGLAAMAMALGARPLPRVGEQAFVMACLLIGVAFTYYMFLPPAGLAALAWLYLRRKRLWRRKWTVLAGIVLACGALVEPIVNARANTGRQLLLTGGLAPVHEQVVVALMLIVLAGATIRRAWRAPSWRIGGLAIGAAVAVAAVIGIYQQVKIGERTYYYEKAVHMVMVGTLVAFGVAARLLPRMQYHGIRSARDLRHLVPSAALAIATFAMCGALSTDSTPGKASWGRSILQNRIGSREAALRAIDVARSFPSGDGVVTVDLGGNKTVNFYSTLYSSVMQRNYTVTEGWYVFLAGWQRNDLAKFEAQLLKTDRPVRFLVADPDARFLLVDEREVHHAVNAYPADSGDNRAMTNIQAVEYLKQKYPDRVEIVRGPMSPTQLATRTSWLRDKDKPLPVPK